MGLEGSRVAVDVVAIPRELPVDISRRILSTPEGRDVSEWGVDQYFGLERTRAAVHLVMHDVEYEVGANASSTRTALRPPTAGRGGIGRRFGPWCSRTPPDLTHAPHC
jgi:hypothetical protein